MSKIKPIMEKTNLGNVLNQYRSKPFLRTIKPKFLTNKILTKKNQKTKILVFPGNRKLNFDLLNVFYTVTTCGNIRLAAERLFISQPAISICISRLEKELGTLLFKQLNSKKIIKLTPSGLILFNYVQRLFQILQETINLSTSKFLNVHNQKVYSKPLNKKNQFTLQFNRYLILNNQTFSSKNKFLIYNKFYFYLKNLLITDDEQLRYFQTQSKFLFLKQKFKNLNSNLLLPFNDFNLTTFEVNKLTEINLVKKNKLNLNNNCSLIEVQTSQAFNTCIKLKISNLICWGSEI